MLLNNKDVFNLNYLLDYTIYNISNAPAYVNIFNHIKSKYINIRKALRQFVNGKICFTNHLEEEYILKLFDKNHNPLFLDNNRQAFKKVIMKNILPNYNKLFFKKIPGYKEMTNKVKLKLDKYVVDIALIKHDLQHFFPNDILCYLISFITT